MGQRFFRRDSRGLLAAAAILCLAPALSGCAAPRSYAGISFAPGAASPDLQALAQRAQAGDKHAQLELGILYEEGQQVPRDLVRARRLYEAAATDGGRTQHVYIPGVRAAEARVSALAVASSGSGLEEARQRLEALQRAEAGEVPTSLSNEEIWDRLLSAVSAGQPLAADDVAFIFGVDEEFARPSAQPRYPQRPAESSPAPMFIYRVLPCEKAAVSQLCDGPGSVTALKVDHPFESVGPEERRDETRCPKNADVVEHLIDKGWRLESQPTGTLSLDPPHALTNAPAVLDRPNARLLVFPGFIAVPYCLDSLLFLSFNREQ